MPEERRPLLDSSEPEEPRQPGSDDHAAESEATLEQPTTSEKRSGGGLDTLKGMYRFLVVVAAGVVIANWVKTTPLPDFQHDRPLRPKEAQPLPAHLPKAIQREANSAVKVMYNQDLSSGDEGSGVKVGHDLVLTAGHVVLQDNSSSTLECAGSYTLNKYTRDAYDADQIVDWTAVYDDNTDATHGPTPQDMGLLRVRPDAAFDRLPIPRIAAKQPTEGQPVFFVNYEVGGRKLRADHYPNASTASYWDGENYSSPAEYAGTVVGHIGPFLEVATGSDGYGSRKGREVNTHPGASGGPVFNQAGKLIGESIETEGGGETIRDIVRDDDLQLPAHPSVKQLSIVQPLSSKLIHLYVGNLPPEPAC